MVVGLTLNSDNKTQPTAVEETLPTLAPGAAPVVSAADDSDAPPDFLGDFGMLVVTVREVPEYFDERVNQVAESPDAYKLLSGMASGGNAVAALHLYSLLRDCASSPPSQQALEVAINRMYETKVPVGTSPGNVKTSGAHLVRSERRARRIFSQCQPVPAMVVTKRDDWLRTASDLGLPPAMKDYAQKILRTSPDEAFEIYTRLWDMGSATAAGQFSRIYAEGLGSAERDPVRAIAYGFISREHTRRYMNGIENVYGSTIWEEAKQANVESLTKLLEAGSPREHAEAFALAKRLLEENTLCCVN